MSDVRIFGALGGEIVIGEYEENSGDLFSPNAGSATSGPVLKDPMRLIASPQGTNILRINILSKKLRGNVDPISIEKHNLIEFKNIDLSNMKMLVDAYNEKMSGIVTDTSGLQLPGGL